MTEPPYELYAQADLYARPDVTVEVVLDALAAAPWPAISRWWRRDVEPRVEHTGSLRDALRADPALPRIAKYEWWHGDEVHGWFGAVADGGEVGSSVALSLDGLTGDAGARWLTALEAWLTALLAWRRVSHAIVARQGPGGSCVPYLDGIGSRSHLVVADDQLLAQVFSEPSEAIAGGGWTATRFETKQLLSRARTARTPGELLAATTEGQWEMVRRARPKVARYSRAQPTADELPIFRRGEPVVLSLGYHADDQIAVYTCAPPDGEHIRPWEIYALRDVLAERKLPTGEPIKGVEVIFALIDDAEREARPLLDLGIHVRYYDDDGELATFGEVPPPR